MAGVLPQLILVAVLIMLNAVFAGSELALVSLREGQLQRLEHGSGRRALLARLARQPNQFFATIQVGITLAGFLASAAAAVSLAKPLTGPLGFLGGAAEGVAIVLVTLVLTYFTLVFGELAPKRIAMQRAERWGLAVVRPLAWLAAVARPVVWLLSRSTDLVVRIAGADPTLQRADVTEEELRDMVAAQQTFTPEQRRIIDGAFEIAERHLGQVMVPRRDVFALETTTTCREALARLIEVGHSRAPVTEGGDLDDVVGFVHMRQLVDGGDEPVTTRMTDMISFPAAAKVLAVLRSMQQSHAQMALVIDEHGGSDGIVTIEDLVEELVGEIYDETDRDLLGVRHHDDGRLELPGRFPIHDLGELGVEFPTGDYTTIAGLVLQKLGTIPTGTGAQVRVGDWRITVSSMQRRTITGVILEPVEDAQPGE